MIAPCGIEIKVGQVWRGHGNLYEIVYVYSEECVVKRHNGGTYYLSYGNFTNKRGGYCLVKDVPAKEATND